MYPSICRLSAPVWKLPLTFLSTPACEDPGPPPIVHAGVFWGGWGGTVAWQPDLNVSHEMAARFGGTQVIGSKPRRQITSVDTSECPERSPAAARWGSAPPALFLHLPRLWFRVLTHRAVPPPQHRPRCSWASRRLCFASGFIGSAAVLWWCWF